MKISVLLPVYNGGLPLKPAIESILGQEFEEFEFLIIDDASTDGSAAIIRDFAAHDPRIRAIYHTSNQGLAKTLNEGLHAAEGELIARMDQDDEALPQRLNIQYLFMKTRPEFAVAGSYVFHMGISEQRDRLVKLPVSHSKIAETLKRENCLYHPSVIMRRREILDLGGYRSEFKNAEDYDLWLRVSKHYQLANIPVALIRYRFSVTGMTLSRKWEQLYYVFLAQAVHEDSKQSFAECEKAARARLEKTDRSAFMICVATGTAEELMRLGYFPESLKLIRCFSNDIGHIRAIATAFSLYWKRRTYDQSSRNR